MGWITIEDGQPHSQLNFLGNSEFPGCKYIGITTDCTKESMAKKMSNDMPKLMEVLKGKEDLISGEPFTQYYKWEMVKNQINYTIGVPVKEVPADLPAHIKVGELPKTSVQSVEHVGPYRHLGNAWSTFYTMQRNKEFKSSKIHPFETYSNSPAEVDEKELVTRIHFPLK